MFILIVLIPVLLQRPSHAYSYRLEKPIMKILYGAKNGLHAFGYNSAEDEPTWMKSGKM